ncbi:MAG: hypothetical protein CSYNP_02945 [Syntrophus sp. SKADARSKE-3]|nr:hypothetical protein [Syntrophus sp. SKADARSKE-3]
MKKALIIQILLAGLILGLLTGCSTAPPVHDWTMKGYNRLEDFKKYYLEGRTSIAELHFNRAVDEIKKSGDLDLLGRAYIIHMAMEVALLEKAQDQAFLKVDAVEPNTANHNYYVFLTGPPNLVQEILLPDPYQALIKPLAQGRTKDLAGIIANITDPASRLIAAGVCIERGHVDEAILTTAVETASRQGWKKALLVYMDKQRVYYSGIGQQDKAAAILKKIELLAP